MPTAAGPTFKQSLSLLSILIIVASASTRDGLSGRNQENFVSKRQLASLVSYLVPNETYSKLIQRWQRRQNSENELRVLSLLKQVGPDMKPANGFSDPQNVTLDVAQQAWRLMHEHAAEIAGHRVDLMWPVIEVALVEASVSDRCLTASGEVAKAASKLETWAIKLLNSWGNFPAVGLFEGTLGDIGSFHSCLGVAENRAIGHTHYCSFSFRPILPTRKDYELIITREAQALIDQFDVTDAFNALAGKSQYNHYVYFKLGTCLPIGCSPIDAQKIARLLARRAILMSGPVKCHSKFSDDYGQSQVGMDLRISSQDLNNGVYIWKPHVTGTQLVALVLLGALVSLVLLATTLDLILNRSRGSTKAEDIRSGQTCLSSEARQHICASPPFSDNAEDLKLEPKVKRADKTNGFSPSGQDPNNNSDNQTRVDNSLVRPKRFGQEPPLNQLVSDCSLITNTIEFFAINKRDDILCMNGLRCITMSWIILAHTIQYNDWTAFGRIYEIEAQLKSLVNQPIFNASYLVDTFFVMSGLLASHSAFRSKQARNQPADSRRLAPTFSLRTYLIGRYLRLTPQILLVSLLFIVLPLSSSSDGPHWDSMTGEYSENCSNNWWVNLFHIQAFYEPDKMCNFVCWWISVDMLYHVLASLIILASIKFGVRFLQNLSLVLIAGNAFAQAARHYQLGLPPNLLSTIPQTGAMWTEMTLSYFWTPNAHLLPFVVGFLVGFNLVCNEQLVSSWFTPTRVAAGWTLVSGSFGLVLFGTHFWVVGKWQWSSEVSTSWALAAQAIWSLCVSWMIVACKFGHGGQIDRLLSCRLFIVLGKASYMVYLSHFLILFTFFGSQNLLLEPTPIMIIYIILGNVCLSTAFGSILCVAFEMPWLKFQRRLMRLIG